MLKEYLAAIIILMCDGRTLESITPADILTISVDAEERWRRKFQGKHILDTKLVDESNKMSLDFVFWEYRKNPNTSSAEMLGLVLARRIRTIDQALRDLGVMACIPETTQYHNIRWMYYDFIQVMTVLYPNSFVLYCLTSELWTIKDINRYTGTCKMTRLFPVFSLFKYNGKKKSKVSDLKIMLNTKGVDFSTVINREDLDALFNAEMGSDFYGIEPRTAFVFGTLRELMIKVNFKEDEDFTSPSLRGASAPVPAAAATAVAATATPVPDSPPTPTKLIVAVDLSNMTSWADKTSICWEKIYSYIFSSVNAKTYDNIEVFVSGSFRGKEGFTKSCSNAMETWIKHHLKKDVLFTCYQEERIRGGEKQVDDKLWQYIRAVDTTVDDEITLVVASGDGNANEDGTADVNGITSSIFAEVDKMSHKFMDTPHNLIVFSIDGKTSFKYKSLANIDLREIKPGDLVPRPFVKDGCAVFPKECGDTVPIYAFKIKEHQSCLKEVTIPPWIKMIGNEAFAGCHELTKFYVPPGVEFSNNVFGFEEDRIKKLEASTVLNDTYFPNKWGDTVPNDAFSDRLDVVKVVIPPRIKKIGDEAFKSCFNLKEFFVPPGVTFGSSVFGSKKDDTWCSKLQATTVLGDADFPVEWGDTIPTRAFFRRYDVRSVEIPSRIKTISTKSFLNCANLEECVVPSGTEVHEEAFPKHVKVTRV